MDHLNSDSSGTDDDLPNQCLVRTCGTIPVSAALRIISGPATHEKYTDMEFQIHCIETESYSAVLRAFIAQSEDLSWGKEELITELRKELGVSDVEHREILGKIKLDDSINSIREWRKCTAGHQFNAMNPPSSDPKFVGHVPYKRLKPGHMPMVSLPKYPPHAQISPVTALTVPVRASLAMHTRDAQRISNTAALSPQMHAEQSVMPAPQKRKAPSSGKLGGSVIVQKSKKGFVRTAIDGMKPRSDVIEIRATEKLINEIQKICGVNPDPAQVERAKLVLREHEKALMDAIGKLTEVSDFDASPDCRQMQNQYSNEGRERNTQVFHNGAYGPCDQSRDICPGGYSVDHAEISGIPCIDFEVLDSD